MPDLGQTLFYHGEVHLTLIGNYLKHSTCLLLKHSHASSQLNFLTFVILTLKKQIQSLFLRRWGHTTFILCMNSPLSNRCSTSVDVSYVLCKAEKKMTMVHIYIYIYILCKCVFFYKYFNKSNFIYVFIIFHEQVLFYYMKSCLALQSLKLKNKTQMKMRPLFSNWIIAMFDIKIHFFFIQYSAKNTFAVRLEGSREINTIIIDILQWEARLSEGTDQSEHSMWLTWLEH